MPKCSSFGFVADGVPKEGLRIQDVLVRLAILHLVRDKVGNSLTRCRLGLYYLHEHYHSLPSEV